MSKQFLTLLVCLFPTAALALTPFYQGKTITIIQGRDPGGTGDLRVRALFPFLQKYIPGNPTLVSEYMAGGGGRKAANYIYNSAKPDGLTLANPGFAMVSSAILGDSGILYDLNKLHYMGSPYSQYHGLFVTRKEAALNSIEKLRAALGIRVGAQSVGFINYNEGRLFAYILGLNEPKFIASYSGPELDAALLLVIMSRAFRLSGTPNVAPPNMPKDRIAILQEAFRKTFKDPDFARDYKKLTGEDATPLMPEDTERAIQNIPRDQEVVQVFNKLIGAGPLPGK